jgi:hypothetical protein
VVDIFCEPCRFDICTPRFAQAVGIPEVTRRGLCIWDCSDIIIGYVYTVGAKSPSSPRYSPDLNPIELEWAKIAMPVKWFRSETAIERLIAISLRVCSVQNSDSAGWFEMYRHSNPRYLLCDESCYTFSHGQSRVSGLAGKWTTQ